MVKFVGDTFVIEARADSMTAALALCFACRHNAVVTEEKICMSLLETLTPAERAKQLREPEGRVGLEMAHWTSEHNREGNAMIVTSLAIRAGSDVLEIGFGDGRTVPMVMAQAIGVQYDGLDHSPTMVEEAKLFNRELIAAGKASFTLGSANRMPYADASFDFVFSIGVVHFWTDPEVALAEVRRVLRVGGTMVMGCLSPKEAPSFARAEYGFHLREAATWEEMCLAAKFSEAKAEEIAFERQRPDGSMMRLHTIRIEARA